MGYSSPLIVHVRNEQKQILGTLVAIENLDTKKVYIGWSKRNPKDQINRIRGIQIAVDRAVTPSKPIRPELMPYVPKLIERSKAYFKETDAIIVNDENRYNPPCLDEMEI